MTPTRASGWPTAPRRRPCRSPRCPQARSTAIPTGRRTTARSPTPPVPRSAGHSRYAIWIVDLRTGDQSEFVPAAHGQDRPTWSPGRHQDRLRLGREHLGEGHRAGLATGADHDRHHRPATGVEPRRQHALLQPRSRRQPRPLQGHAGRADGHGHRRAHDATDDWQPAVSPDGTRLCFLRGPQTDMADLYTVNVERQRGHPVLDDRGRGRSQLRLVARRLAGALHARRVRRRRPRVDGQERQRPPAPHQPERGGALRRQRRLGHELLAQVRQPSTSQVAVNGFARITLAASTRTRAAAPQPPTPTPIDGQALAIASRPSHGNIGGISDDGQVDLHAEARTSAAPTASPTRATTRCPTRRRPRSRSRWASTGGAGRDSTAVPELKLPSKRWRLGRRCPARARVGTTISFRLSEPGKVTARLPAREPPVGERTQVREGHAPQSHASAPAPASWRGQHHRAVREAGLDSVRFQGRLSRSRRLALGSYRVSGQRGGRRRQRLPSATTAPAFTIVAG